MPVALALYVLNPMASASAPGPGSLIAQESAGQIGEMKDFHKTKGTSWSAGTVWRVLVEIKKAWKARNAGTFEKHESGCARKER